MEVGEKNHICACLLDRADFAHSAKSSVWSSLVERQAGYRC